MKVKTNLAALLLAVPLFLGMEPPPFRLATPDETKQQEQRVKKWQRALAKNYNLGALHSFLAEQIKAHPEVEGVSLATAKLGAKWEELPWEELCSDDWSFRIDERETDKFHISWVYESTPNSLGYTDHKQIEFLGQRLGKSKFALIGVRKRSYSSW